MTEVDENKYIDDIVELIQKNESLINFSHHGKEDQIAIQKSLRDQIFDLVASIEDEKIDAKDLIRLCVRKALELEESDIVIIKQDFIFIKIFDHSKKRVISESDEGTIASRFNGIDEEELLSFYEEYFLQENPKAFFVRSARLFVEKYFVDRQLDNNLYEKYVFAYVQAIIIEQLEEIYDHNREFFKGFAGYAFRKHFKEVFANIADAILSEIVIGNKYMTEFLKYYSLDIVIINGEKYKVPPLETPEGLKWNVVSLHSVVKVYINTLQNIKSIQKEMESIEEDLDALYIGEISPVEYNDIYLKEKKKLNDMIEIYQKKLNRSYDAYEVEGSKEKRERIKLDIDKLKRSIEILRDKKTKLSAKALKKELINTFIELDKEYQGFERELKREQKILAQNKDAYMSIKSALTKVLVSKKKRLDEV